MPFHPWRALRRMPAIDVWWGHLPSGAVGATDGEVIYLDSRQSQAQRRSTLTHELVHVERGHRGCQPEIIERDVQREAARRLIPMPLLLDKLSWTEDLAELASECWVDRPTLMARLDSLTEAERAQIVDLYERTERGA
ncbi:MAG: ImmA/IrrE family metallo-endopeptidase [bacterium]|nr:ImmA/IrrE family metallo-endopeptidase [bacterium]